MGGGEAGGSEKFSVDDDKETFAAGEDGAVGTLDFGLVEDFAIVGAIGFGGAVKVAGYED